MKIKIKIKIIQKRKSKNEFYKTLNYDIIYISVYLLF